LSGTLAKTPMPRLLMSASHARVTGTLELRSGDGDQQETATLVMVRGLITKVKTSAAVVYLGTVLYELGYIDNEVLNDSLRELARMKWLHGEILLTRAAITQAQLAEGLAEQTTRKLVHLFTLPPSTTYSFQADFDGLASWGGTDCPHVDPTIAVWRGVREGYAEEDVDAAFERVQKNAFRLAMGVDPKRFDLTDVELGAVECLRARALTLDELSWGAAIDPKRARALLYFLMVTKQAESLDTSGVRPAYRPPADAGARSATPAPSRVPANPNTKPTVPEMPAVGSAPRISIPREPTESAKWRAVAPVSGGSSSKIAIADMQPLESAKLPVAQRLVMNTPQSFPARITMGGVQPSSVPPKRTTPMPAHQSTGQFNSKVVAELASRRQSIFERARAILREDHFQRLSLPRDAQSSQVEAAFTALKTLWDPELLPPALEEAKSDCGFVLSCLVEAYTALRNDRQRIEYAQSLTLAALRPQRDQSEDDMAAIGASDPYEGAVTCFAQGDLERAERLAKRATKLSPEAAKPLALLAWIEATKPANMSPEETKKRIVMLDRALRADEKLEQAYYWRALLHKRIDSHATAMFNLRKVVELNPKHMDAVRELRVYEMRIRRNSLTMKAVK
jgi:tetratricopeptide (TPR) repeat protein